LPSRPRLAALIAGLALVLAAQSAAAGPLDGFNRANRRLNFWLLDHVFEPVARGYNVVMPKWGQERVRNVLQNLERPRDFVNSVLQAKPIRAGRHLASFAVDSTVGVLGAFSVAERVIEVESPETTGETLGVWRIPAGSYLVLPVLGDTTPRGLVGMAGDAVLNPLFWIPGNAGTAATAGANLLGNVNLLARQMPSRGAEDEAWEAYRERFLERPGYEEARELFFENLALDVAD
jgi:phospholipid-binding lipoprotein MlaA